MILKKIKLHNWKNFQNCEVVLTERCFIIGANASGKSNFIDALRFLRDISKQSGGLQTAVEERGGITNIHCLSSTQNSHSISIAVELGYPNQEQNIWRYHIEFANTTVTNVIVDSDNTYIVDDEGKPLMAFSENRTNIVTEEVYSYQDGKYILQRNEKDKGEDIETLKQTYLEQTTANRNFRELQAFFQNIEYLNVIPQMIRESSSIVLSPSREDYFGRNFLEKIAKMSEKTRDSYFKTIRELLKIAIPQLRDFQFVQDKMGTPHLEASYVHWQEKGSIQQEMHFSDGTLRLVGFLFALLDNHGIVLLEEPEINLHSGIISQIPAFISQIQRSKKIKTQILVTTHSYDILSDKGISTDEVLVLQNTEKGTEIQKVTDRSDLRAVVFAGLSIADAVIPITTPEGIEKLTQLTIF